jgi:hypothetical protein
MTSASETAEFLAYAVWHRATDADWVASHLTDLLKDAGFRGSEALADDLAKVRDIARTRWTRDLVSNNGEAAEALLQHALEAYQPNAFDSATYYDLATLSAEAYLGKATQVHLATFAEAGLELADPPKALLVDQYPRPYDKLTGSALAPDRTDRERYGFENAIYLRKAKYSPVAASLILAHEFTHSFIADDGELARGLEEGIADFFAYCVIAPRVLSPNILANHFSTRRISYQRTKQRFHLYADYMRRTHWLWQVRGFSFLRDLLNAGRREIKRVENALNDVAAFRAAATDGRGARDMVEENIADELALLAMENEVYSPLALFYCMRSVQPDLAPMAPKLSAKIRDELQTRTFAMVTGDDGTVEFEDLAAPARCRWARFDPHE